MDLKHSLTLLAIACSVATFNCSAGAVQPSIADLLNHSNKDLDIPSSKALTNTPSQSIDWQPCTKPRFHDWFNIYAQVTNLQCATINIPLDQFDSNSSTLNANPIVAINTEPKTTVIKLALTRSLAKNQHNPKRGTLIKISGGPGQSGVNLSKADSLAYRRLSKHFDIIGYAPRGVYPSTPAIKCEIPDSDLELDVSVVIQKRIAACWAQTPNDLLKRLGGEYSVDDIESIRLALGVDKISLIGYSYGTMIATLYAEKYPQHLRAAVLDGLVDLNETDISMRSNQQTSMQNTFERFVTWCRQQNDCYFEDTHSIKAAEKKLAKLFLKIERRDIKDHEGKRIYPGDVRWEIGGLLMWPSYWTQLNTLLIALDNDDYDYLKRLIESSASNIDKATFFSISCADAAPNDTQKLSYLKATKRINAISTWDNYRKFKDEELLSSCYYWPVAGVEVTHVPKLSPTLPPLLLVAQTDDPATPYKNAVAMQRYTDGILLTRKGDGHTLVLMNNSKCVDNKAVEYLINPKEFANKNPSKNLTCLD